MSDVLVKLLKERIIYVGDLNEAMATAVAAQLQALATDPSRPASLYINSRGGPLPVVLRIYEAMSGLPYELATVAMGRVEYAANLLLAAGTPGKRAAASTARFLLGPPVVDQAGLDFQSYLKAVQTTCETVNGLLSRQTGQTVQRLAAFSQPTELTPAQALDLGLIDRILPPPK